MFREIGAKDQNKVLIFGQSPLISEWSVKGIENDEKLWEKFEELVAKAFAGENTGFIDEMKGINYDKNDVQSIMETYINEGSTKQVNLSGPQRQRVIDAYDSLDPNNAQTIRVLEEALIAAKTEIMALLQKNFWPVFPKENKPKKFDNQVSAWMWPVHFDDIGNFDSKEDLKKNENFTEICQGVADSISSNKMLIELASQAEITMKGYDFNENTFFPTDKEGQHLVKREGALRNVYVCERTCGEGEGKYTLTSVRYGTPVNDNYPKERLTAILNFCTTMGETKDKANKVLGTNRVILVSLLDHCTSAMCSGASIGLKLFKDKFKEGAVVDQEKEKYKDDIDVQFCQLSCSEAINAYKGQMSGISNNWTNLESWSAERGVTVLFQKFIELFVKNNPTRSPKQRFKQLVALVVLRYALVRSSSQDYVLAYHCESGKDRTGLMFAIEQCTSKLCEECCKNVGDFNGLKEELSKLLDKVFEVFDEKECKGFASLVDEYLSNIAPPCKQRVTVFPPRNGEPDALSCDNVGKVGQSDPAIAGHAGASDARHPGVASKFLIISYNIAFASTGLPGLKWKGNPIAQLLYKGKDGAKRWEGYSKLVSS